MCSSAAGCRDRGYRSRLAGSVLVGVPGADVLRYAGDLGSGFTVAPLRDLTATLTGLEQPDSPFAGIVPAEVSRRAR
jgi:bifunctional non-homologous end joining protein LigD